jgi:aminopeptidase
VEARLLPKEEIMADPRVTKLAKILVHYSLRLKPGQQVFLQTSPLADELNLAFYEEAVKTGAHVTIVIDTNYYPGAAEIFYKYARNAQLDHVSPVRKLIYETFEARLVIEAKANTRELAGIDPRKIARGRKANAPLFKTFLRRVARKDPRWCMTVHPTPAMAQEADMSLNDYREFVYAAGMLNEKDPVVFWMKEAKRQRQLIRRLKDHQQVTLKGENIDLKLSIKGRTFISCAGNENFPDGEIFTSPVDNSANGWVRFKYPSLFDGQEIEDIQLWFENGKVIKEKARRNQALLTAQLNIDRGARYLGEWVLARTMGSSSLPKTCSSMKKSGARSISPWASASPKRVVKTSLDSIGTCCVI